MTNLMMAEMKVWQVKKGKSKEMLSYNIYVLFFSVGLKVSEVYICHKRKTELKVNVMAAEGSNTHRKGKMSLFLNLFLNDSSEMCVHLAISFTSNGEKSFEIPFLVM